jgi:hypothetical protein
MSEPDLENVCLHVLAIKELSLAGNVERFVWADAVKVTC